MWNGKWKRSWRWYVLYISYEPVLWFGSWWKVHCRHTAPRSHCETKCVCNTAVCVLHTVDRDWHTEVTELCVGHMCLACVPHSRVCRSTCMSRWCSHSERSCMDWYELLVLHTHQYLKKKNNYQWVWARKKLIKHCSTVLNTYISTWL